MTVTSLPFSSSTLQVERLGVLAAELEDVAHLDAARGLQACPSAQFGQASPSRTSAASMVPSAVKSRPATRSSTCQPASSAPVTQRVPSTTRGSTQVADPGRVLLAQHARADVALDQRRVLREVGLVERLDLGGSSWPSSRFWSTSRSPGTPMASGSRVPSGCTSTTSTFFSVSPAVQGRSSRGNCCVEVVDQRLDGRGVRASPRRGRRARRRTAPAAGARTCDRLDVGGVVAGACSGRRCPRRPRRWRGTPRDASRPSRPTSP